MHTDWEVGGRGDLGARVSGLESAITGGAFAKVSSRLRKTERNGGSGAVSDRLASEALPVWFPFKSTHMARICLKVSSMLCTLPQKQECLRFSEPGGRCGPRAPRPSLFLSNRKKETQAVPGQRSSETGDLAPRIACLGVPRCLHLYAG